MAEIDSYAEALSEMFLANAETVRGYWRAHVGEMSPEESADLLGKVHDLESLHDQFGAEAIGDRLESVRDYLDDLTSLTTESKTVLNTLNRLQLVADISTALFEAGSAAACGDYEGMAGKLATLAQAIAKSKEPAAAGAGQQTT